MAAGGSDVILSIKDVSKSFPGVKALDKVSIDFRRGIGATASWAKTARASRR